MVLVVALYACMVFGAQISTTDSPAPTNPWPGWILAALCAAALLTARTRPRVAVVVTAVAAAIATWLGSLPTPLLLAPVMAALFWLADLTDAKTISLYGYPTMAVLVTTSLFGAPLGDDFVLRSMGTILWLLFPLALGSPSRPRRSSPTWSPPPPPRSRNSKLPGPVRSPRRHRGAGRAGRHRQHPARLCVGPHSSAGRRAQCPARTAETSPPVPSSCCGGVSTGRP
ncbi:hypothetical protein OG979_34475 [Actinomadura citrea]|uniref:hypothetical protein n=1 Tax=Actinomadura citrea TaxID=46158 RepID=UPI002E2BF136|nr:hypothetical protein [Actinomadura citrea]